MTRPPERPPSPIDQTEVDGATEAPLAEGTTLADGTRIGDYVLRGLLGTGGMGHVYLADQTAPVRRQIALKLMRAQVSNPLALVWFEVERQALAQMQHPAIAQVFDAGTTPEGVAYLAMELVEGEPVTVYCREHALSKAQRLALFVRICQGVQHAHQKGVIHRDIKPANVLVREIDGVAQPKIIDFGIAIGGADSDSGPAATTDTSGRAGTAVYMSPEQSTGSTRDIDTRSDVYSLGVLLFEMLTDTHAAGLTSSAAYQSRQQHRHATLRDTLLAADDVADVPAGADLLEAAQGLPVELRAVLARSLAGDRNDRYASALALADDLERYRLRRPLQAMPASRRYVLGKFIARHRLGLAAASLVLGALIVGAVLAINGQRRAEAAATLAGIEADKARQIAAFVQDMLGGIDPDRAKGMDRTLMRLVLDSAAERAGSELAQQPEVRFAIERMIAQSYARIGEYALAAEHFAAAVASAQSGGATLDERVRLQSHHADAIGNQGKFDEALALGEQVVALSAALPEDDRTRLFAESRMAWHERAAGKLDASIARYERVHARQLAMLGADDAETLESQRGLAAAYTRADRYDEAKPLLEDALERYRARFGESNTRTLDVSVALAVMFLEQERFVEAEAILQPALPIAETLLGPDHSNTLVIVSNLGSAIRNQQRLEEARPYYERTLQTNLRLHGPDHYLSVSGQSNLARLLRDLGEIEAAERHARLSIVHMDKAFGQDNPARAIFITAFARVLVGSRKFEEAERELDRAFAILTTHPAFGPTHSRTMDAIKEYVALYTAWHRPALAAQWQARLP